MENFGNVKLEKKHILDTFLCNFDVQSRQYWFLCWGQGETLNISIILTTVAYLNGYASFDFIT